MSLGEDIDLWKLIQLLNCGSYGGTSIGKQAKSVILHPAAKKMFEFAICTQSQLYQKRCLQSQLGHFMSSQHSIILPSLQLFTGVSAKS